MPVEGYFYPVATSNVVSQTASFTQGTGGTDYPTTTTYVAFRINTGTSFTTIGHVSAFLYKDAGITTGSTMKAELYTDVAGAPGVLVTLNGVPDHTTGYTFNPYSLGVGAGYTEVKFFLPVTGLTPNTDYWVVFDDATFSGGQVHFDTRVSASNYLATSANKVAWAGVLKEVKYTIYPTTALSVYTEDPDNFAIYATSDDYMAVRGSSVSGFGVYGISTYHYGVGGNSEYLTGVRGSSTYGLAVHGESLNLTGGMFQADAGVFPALQGAHLSIGAGVQGYSTGGDYLQAASSAGVGWRVGTNFENIVQPPAAVAGGGTWTSSYFAQNVTLNGGTVTTDMTTSIPANSIVDAVSWRITTTFGTAVSFQIGVPGTLDNFQASIATVTAGNTGVGLNQWITAAKVPAFTAATTVRITTNANPTAGAIRIIVWYRQFVPPTS